MREKQSNFLPFILAGTFATVCAIGINISVFRTLINPEQNTENFLNKVDQIAEQLTKNIKNSN